MPSNSKGNPTASASGSQVSTTVEAKTGTPPGLTPQGKPARPRNLLLIGLLKPYMPLVAAIIGFTITANALNLLIPKIIARAIDTFASGQPAAGSLVVEFLLAVVGIFVFTYCQSVAQVYASERVARDLRTKIVAKLATQELAYINRVGSAVLLTNLTSDVDAVKIFVAQVVGSIVSSVFLIVGTSILLLTIDWKLGLAVIAVLPIIGVAFRIVLGKIRNLFTQAQQTIDRLNRIINESILGAALIRLLNSQHYEYEKFLLAATDARDIGLSILRLFASLIPIIVFSTNMATLMILTFGGRFVIQGNMTLGNFTAFNSYLGIVIFPVILIGFMSTLMAQAAASYARIAPVLNAPSPQAGGTIQAALKGDIELKKIVVQFGEKTALKDVSISIKAGSKTAVIGPTAAGKTQLLYLLTGLLKPTSGTLSLDGRDIEEYEKSSVHQQIGLVFQDATMFNLTLRENIGFSKTVKDEDLAKAIETAELKAFIDTLPQGLETMVAERGTSLSGGQKQRIMLARALALNPRVLLLDDFTARVDAATEARILENVHRNYPGITLLSVTQKIAPVEDYDRIVLLMEGEVLATGRHADLLETCPEYVQIYESQRSTQHYESVRA